MLKYTSAKAMAEWCKGNIPASDSVVLGSNPGSAAKETRLPYGGRVSFLCQRNLWLQIKSFCPLGRKRLVRICRAERVVLAHKRQACKYSHSEYPRFLAFYSRLGATPIRGSRFFPLSAELVASNQVVLPLGAKTIGSHLPRRARCART